MAVLYVYSGRQTDNDGYFPLHTRVGGVHDMEDAVRVLRWLFPEAPEGSLRESLVDVLPRQVGWETVYGEFIDYCPADAIVIDYSDYGAPIFVWNSDVYYPFFVCARLCDE